MEALELILNRFAKEDNDCESYLCIYKKNQPRWIIPSDRESALICLNKVVEPFSSKTILGLIVLKFFIYFSIVRFLVNIKEIKLPIKNKSWRSFECSENADPIISIHVGTRDEDQKYSIIILDKKTKTKLLVIKYPIALNSWNKIEKEFLNLRLLTKELNVNTPKPLIINYEEGYTVQTALNSRKSKNLNLTKEHYKFLSSLVLKTKMIDLVEVKKYLCSFYESNKQFIKICDYKNEFLNIILGTNWQGEINQTIVHGDFTPWNIFVNNSSGLEVFDWEDLELNGLPFYDLYYYKYQIKKLLFKDISIDKEIYKEYILRKGITFDSSVLNTLRISAKIMSKVNIYKQI